MKKILRNKLIIFILLFLIILLINSTVQATSDIISAGKDFISTGKSQTSPIDTGKQKNASDFIYNILLAIATIAAVIVASIMGINFMMASVEGKAEIKESLMPFIVGCIVVFGAFGIWKVIVNAGNSIEKAAYDVKQTVYIADAN